MHIRFSRSRFARPFFQDSERVVCSRLLVDSSAFVSVRGFLGPFRALRAACACAVSCSPLRVLRCVSIAILGRLLVYAGVMPPSREGHTWWARPCPLQLLCFGPWFVGLPPSLAGYKYGAWGAVGRRLGRSKNKGHGFCRRLGRFQHGAPSPLLPPTARATNLWCESGMV